MAAKKDHSDKFSDLTSFKLDAEMLQRLPEKLCREHQMVLLGIKSPKQRGPVPLGMLNINNDAAVEAAASETGWKFERIQLNAYEVDKALDFGFGKFETEENTSITVRVDREQIMLAYNNTIKFHRDQSATGMIVDMFSEAVQRRATDIHLEIYSEDVDIRFRVDGVLQQIQTPISRGNVKKVVSYLKILADLDIAEHRFPQDGRIDTVYSDEEGNQRQIDLRMAVLPGPWGEDVVLRLLDEKKVRLSLGDLGMSEALQTHFGGLLQNPGGTILVTGPTASGKTTTLYAALKEVNTDANKVLTVEDPIEYTVPKVNQKQISPRISFADYSRAFMRQNPDILMIGEVRDEETAAIVLRAAQTGVLVLSTLHTRDAASAMDRLLVLGADRSLAAAGLLGIISQRLVRRVCEECAEPYTPDAALLARLPVPEIAPEYRQGAGCKHCSGTGYYGQTGVFELIVLNQKLRRELAMEGAIISPIPDFVPMFQDGMNRAAAGITTVDELLRAVPLPESDPEGE